MTRRRPGHGLFAVAAAGSAVLLVTACGTGAAGTGGGVPADASPALKSLIEAAQKEGELVWYSVPTESIAKAVSDAFAKKYKIKVKFIRMASADLAQRFTAEAGSGEPAADMFVASMTPFVQDAAKRGLTTPLPKAGIPEYPGDFPKRYLVPGAGTAVVQIQPSGIAVNTDLAEGAIKDWPDVLDPRWKGKVILVDPRTSAAYTPFWNLIIKHYGKDFLTRLRAQSPKLAAGSAPASQKLAAGEGAVVMPGVQSIIESLKKKGAPVSYAQPAASTGPEIVPGLAAKARHPKAARLFVHYLLSKEGNKVLNGVEPGSASPRDPASVPASYTFNRELTGTSAEEIQKLLGL